MRGFEMRGKWPGYMRTSTQVVMSPWGRLLVQRGSRAGGAAAALWRQPKVCMCICTSRRGSRGNRGFSAFVPGVGHFSENAYRGTHMYTLILSKNSGRTPPPTVGAMVSSMWYLHRNDPSDRADDGGELLSSTVLYIHSPSPSPYTPTCTSLSSVSTHPSIEAPPSTQDSPRPYPCMPIASPNAYPCPWSPPIPL